MPHHRLSSHLFCGNLTKLSLFEIKFPLSQYKITECVKNVDFEKRKGHRKIDEDVILS